MRFIDKTFLGMSTRSWLCVVILIGSFFTVHGMVMNIKAGGHVLEYTFGIIISVIGIIFAAVPSEK